MGLKSGVKIFFVAYLIKNCLSNILFLSIRIRNISPRNGTLVEAEKTHLKHMNARISDLTSVPFRPTTMLMPLYH